MNRTLIAKSRRRVGPAALVLTLATLTACGGASSSETSAEPLEPGTSHCDELAGDDITLTVPYSPGGGYDTYARLIAPVLGEKIGSSVVVENVDGAGGLLAMNNLVKADKDGTEILIMNGIGAGGASIAEAQGVQFSLDELSYIGRIAGDTQVMTVSANSRYQTWDDVIEAEGFRFGSTGQGAADYVTPSVLISIFDLDAELVTGFGGSSEVELSVLQGDVDGMTGSLDSRLPAIKSGDQRALLTLSEERPEQLPDTTLLKNVDLEGEQKEVARGHLSLLALGRPLVAPADLDAKALACLRGALKETLQDSEVIAKSKKINRPINYLSGAKLDEKVDEVVSAPDEYAKVLNEAFTRGAN